MQVDLRVQTIVDGSYLGDQWVVHLPDNIDSATERILRNACEQAGVRELALEREVEHLKFTNGRLIQRYTRQHWWQFWRISRHRMSATKIGHCSHCYKPVYSYQPYYKKVSGYMQHVTCYSVKDIARVKEWNDAILGDKSDMRTVHEETGTNKKDYGEPPF